MTMTKKTIAMVRLAMARLAMAMVMVMARLKLTPDLNVNNGYDGRAVKVAMRVLREEIEAFLGKSTSVNSAIKMRGERHSRSRSRRRRGGRMDVTKLSRKPRSAAGLGIVHNVTQNPRGLVSALRLETGVQQVLGAMAGRAVTRSSRMGRALAWNGAGGPPQVDQACAGGTGREGVAELQGAAFGPQTPWSCGHGLRRRLWRWWWWWWCGEGLGSSSCGGAVAAAAASEDDVLS